MTGLVLIKLIWTTPFQIDMVSSRTQNRIENHYSVYTKTNIRRYTATKTMQTKNKINVLESKRVKLRKEVF